MLARPPRDWGSLCSGGPTDTTPGTGHCCCSWPGAQLCPQELSCHQLSHRGLSQQWPLLPCHQAGRKPSATLPAGATGTPGPRAGIRPQGCKIHLHALKATTALAAGAPGSGVLQGLMFKAWSLQRLRALLPSLLCAALSPDCSRDKSQARGSSPCPHSCCWQRPLVLCPARGTAAGTGQAVLSRGWGSLGPVGAGAGSHGPNRALSSAPARAAAPKAPHSPSIPITGGSGKCHTLQERNSSW